MNPEDPLTVYTPSADEPSVFSDKDTGVPIEWTSWFSHIQVFGRDSGRPYSLKRPNYDVVSVAVELRNRIREELLTQRVTLPPRPPSMYVAGTDYISLAWVLDVARRDHLTPEEAMQLAAALKRM
jgi:hypothetical protein